MNRIRTFQGVFSNCSIIQVKQRFPLPIPAKKLDPNARQEEDEMRSVGLRHGKRGKAVEALINRALVLNTCISWVVASIVLAPSSKSRSS